MPPDTVGQIQPSRFHREQVCVSRWITATLWWLGRIDYRAL
jgi:hypothetical protein